MWKWIQRYRAAKAADLESRRLRANQQWEVIVSFTGGLPDHRPRFTGHFAAFDPVNDIPGQYMASSYAARIVREGVWLKGTLIPPSRIASVSVREVPQADDAVARSG